MSIGAIHGVGTSMAAIGSYAGVEAARADALPRAVAGGGGAGASASSGSRPTEPPDGTGIGQIVDDVDSFMSDYDSVYGNGPIAGDPTKSNGLAASGDASTLASDLKAMARDFARFFGTALGGLLQPFGLPMATMVSHEPAQTATGSATPGTSLAGITGGSPPTGDGLHLYGSQAAIAAAPSPPIPVVREAAGPPAAQPAAGRPAAGG